MKEDIKILKLKKYFNGELVLDIENMVFKGGEINFLLGENGAGKSTILNIIAKLDSEFKGKIDNKYKQKEISLVDANPYMLKGDIYKNIAYPLELRKDKDIDKKMKILLKFFNIKLLKDQDASKLSSGESQKVAIIRALSYSPKLLILDEPTANLDKETKLELANILKNYNEKGNTLIIVTHDNYFLEHLEGNKIEIEKLEGR